MGQRRRGLRQGPGVFTRARRLGRDVRGRGARQPALLGGRPVAGRAAARRTGPEGQTPARDGPGAECRRVDGGPTPRRLAAHGLAGGDQGRSARRISARAGLSVGWPGANAPALAPAGAAGAGRQRPAPGPRLRLEQRARGRPPPTRLVAQASARYFIERSFQDAKGNLGLADYQVRGWRGWHHHVALVMLAMLFELRERMLHAETTPLLSCADVVALLVHFLPRRATTREAALEQLRHRHRQRQASIDSATKNQTPREQPHETL